MRVVWKFDFNKHRFYYFVSVSPAGGDIKNTWKSTSSHSKHFEVSQKYSTVRCFFNFLLDVWRFLYSTAIQIGCEKLLKHQGKLFLFLPTRCITDDIRRIFWETLITSATERPLSKAKYWFLSKIMIIELTGSFLRRDENFLWIVQICVSTNRNYTSPQLK